MRKHQFSNLKNFGGGVNSLLYIKPISILRSSPSFCNVGIVCKFVCVCVRACVRECVRACVKGTTHFWVGVSFSEIKSELADRHAI